MSTNLTGSEHQDALTRTRTGLFTAFLLVPIVAACGSDNTSSSDYTGEFGNPVESNAQITAEPPSNDAADILRDLIDTVASALFAIVWTILRTLACFAVTGWIGIVVLIAAFFSAAIYYLRYHLLKYDWHKAIAVGAIASIPVLIVRVLC